MSDLTGDGASERERVLDAYKRGVAESAGDIHAIYINPDEIKDKTIVDNPDDFGPPYFSLHGRGESLRHQLDTQIPGAMDAFVEMWNRKSKNPHTLDEIANATKREAVFLAYMITINGKRIGVAGLPGEPLDSLEGVIRYSLKEYDKYEQDLVIENARKNGITSEIMLRGFGNHEGEHIRNNLPQEYYTEVLTSETISDKELYEKAAERGELHFIRFFQDIRHLAASDDPGHATGSLVNTGRKATIEDVLAAENHRNHINDMVAENFDFKNYSGNATSPKELRRENPEAYFAAMHEGIEQYKTKRLAIFKIAPPSHFELQELILAERTVEYHINFENAYRRRVLHQDIPQELASTQLIRPEEKEAYRAEAEINERIDEEYDALYEKAFDEYSAETTSFKTFDWGAYGGTAKTPHELRDENPVLFFETIVQYIEGHIERTQQAHQANPSYDTTETLLKLESLYNNYADLLQYERSESQGTASLYKKTRLVNEDDRRAYFMERFERNAEPSAQPENAPASPPPSTQGEQKTGSAEFCRDVLGLTPGNPDICYDRRLITVAGTPIETVFAQSANPSPDRIVFKPSEAAPGTPVREARDNSTPVPPLLS